ncbi:xanthine dehydrogenase family protein molybdopterin-binding subunit [Hyphomicrobium sp. CS1GBMeth3]|uniref:xanthine dehydrogenase family protein molybdopterin-binding subunit n=1 Tax=Hyphomicrobium sp. CS1GBMeth3 TaxID=1892845 RepID=UPI00093201B6|nr:xanthine dehydrogenase family protein molybdopterin-binding subunit [Hyphomicrobium sp. CS1GBMeth3]
MTALRNYVSSLSRRSFLQVSAAVGGGLIIGWVPESHAADTDDASGPFAPNAFIRIDRSGVVTVVSPSIEMGQGTYTALPMLVAEELDVAMSQIRVDHAPASDKLYGNPSNFNAQITGGSTAVRGFYKPMREAGAAARQMLVAAAAAQLGVEAQALTTEAGEVVHAASGRRVGYGTLVDDAAKLPVPTNVALKDPSKFRVIGTSARRTDSPGKVDGTAMFGIDAKVPGMKVAAVAASPVFGGKLASVDEAAALAVPGVRQVAKLDDAVAVIADHYWAARMGLEAAAPQFDDGALATMSTEDIVAALAKAAERDGVVAQSVGDAVGALGGAVTKVDSTYENPFLAHATMEPMNCTVHVTPGGCDIWVGTQIPTIAQTVVAKALGLDAEKVRIHNHLLGGGFGRRLEFDFILQAALIAKQSKDPVKVIWSREEDIQHDMYRPYYYDRISAGLDANGKIAAWNHRIVGPSIVARFAPPAFKDGIDFDIVDGAIDLEYDIPNFKVDYVREEPPGIPTAFWRGVGPTRNGYVVECFVDELAAAAKQDPVAFRRAHLGKSPRALHVLERAAEISGWDKPLPARKGRGVSVMKAMASYIAQVAEVTVAEDGEVHVDRVVCVVDTGIAVNPDIIVAQMQSGIIFGVTAVLWGEITLKNGRVEQSNFDTYRVMRLDEIPKIEVEVVKSSADPGGIGEPGTCALAPAVLNAVYAATGVRLYKQPIKPELLKA